MAIIISATANSIHLYTTHRAVIVAIAQLSCLALNVSLSKTVGDTAEVTINGMTNSKSHYALSIDTKIDDLG